MTNHLAMRKRLGIMSMSAVFIGLSGIFLGACTAGSDTDSTLPSKPAPIENPPEPACPVTSPKWVLPPHDSAVDSEPAYGYYYINDDGSIMASAWWTFDEQYRRVNEDGVKVGWFRPEGAELVIAGQRLDGEAPPMHSHVPCCYPTRFQATGLYFPTEGCWQVSAKAADSELTFVVSVEP